MRAPSLYTEPPGPPKGSRLYAVRYTDARGQTVTTLFWRLHAAERFAGRVEARGGAAVIFRTTIGRWVR